jgi:intracellular sulfur oxidation DsrE/DsrF family protein
MGNFLHSLARAEDRPSAVMLANEAVRLTCEGSHVLEDLQMLEEAGVMVRSCGTCLEVLGLTDDVRVGGVGAMDDMVAAVLGDDEVVTIA